MPTPDRWGWLMRRRDTGSSGRELIVECEAVLAGRYVEHLVDSGHSVPAWAWTNLLAHGAEEQLRSPLTKIDVCRATGLESWCHARSYLAGEVLDRAHRDGPLDALQGAVLIPLELELMSRPVTRLWRPGDWVTAVLAAVAPMGEWQRTRRP